MIINKIEAISSKEGEDRVNIIALLPNDQQDKLFEEVPDHLKIVDVDGHGNTIIAGIKVILTSHVTELTFYRDCSTIPTGL